jgi:glycosyltransferase involved in cell wall biosynthesis
MKEPGTVLIAVPDDTWPYGGNATTARRLAAHQRQGGRPAEAVPVSGLAARLEAGDVHLVHALHLRKGGVPVRALCRGRRIPFLVTCTGTDLSHDVLVPELRSELRSVVEEAAAITVLHGHQVQVVLKHFPFARPRLYRIRPGVDVLPGRRERARFGFRADEFVFLLPAGLRAVKRPAFAVEPLAEVRREGWNVVLAIAGPVQELSCGREVAALAERHPFVRLLGVKAHEAMGSLYRAADVVLNTSSSEGLSNAVLEAMALGRPLLLSDNEGNREAADDPVRPAALFFRDEEEFLASARRLLQDRRLRRELGALAQARARNLFDPEAEGRAFGALYARVLAATRKAEVCSCR